MHRKLRWYLYMATVFVTLAPVQAQLGGGGKAKARVELVASATGVVPGQPIEVALRFQLEAGWHIYWENSGDSGLPPTVNWDLPDGFTAGELQYPIPKRHESAGDIVTNILEGEPTLLVRITPPETITGERVTLAADVQYLICKKNCIRESTKVALELPVLATGGRVKAANESLFKKARRALPKGSSKYLSVSAYIKPFSPTPGRLFELVINVDIKRGYHIQSHAPLNPAFIKCDVFLKPAWRITFDEAVYPPPTLRMLKYVGQVSEYVGKISVRVPARLDDGATALPNNIGGIFKYQACDSKGTCFPPDALAFTAAGLPAQAGGESPSHAIAASVTPSDSDAIAPLADRAEAALAQPEGVEGFLRGLGMPGLLIMCFFYGMLINATPCVLPLLSIKVLSFVQQAHESRGRTLMLGLSFGGGVVLFFVLLGLLASQGKNILQYPVAVIVLGTVVLAMALSMLGVYTLQVPTSATKLDAAIQREGAFASFGKGALAPVLGFACTAPMMAGGFAWATQQPKEVAILAFFVMGLGMAFPYVILGANPNWLGFLPKPGNWMITFERIMGFLLLGLVVLLIHPLVTHIGVEGLEWTLVFFVAVGLACWLLGKVEITMPDAQRWRYRGMAGTTVLVAAGLIYGWIYPLGPNHGSAPSDGGPISWREWSAEAVEQTVEAGNTVFVDFTSAYCTNCKINKKRAINKPETAQKLKSLGVIAYRADFTGGDARIFEALQRFDRAGPPLNLIYPAGKHHAPIVLDVLFSKQYLLRKLNEAGPSRVKSASSLAP